MNFEQLQRNLSAQRQARNELAQKFQRARETLRTIESHKARLARLGRQDSTEFQQLSQQEAELKTHLPQIQNEFSQARVAAENLSRRLANFQRPQQAVENLDDRTPFLLLPVRLETRFKASVDPATGKRREELWLRIYPDDIQLETHEETLTVSELAATKTYWQEIWRAGGDRDRELGAWRVLIRKYGAQRAAWILQAYQPNNEFDANGNSNRPSRPLKDTEELELEPSFNPYIGKLESWSLPPKITTLPDCFVALGFIGDEKVIEQVGNPIPDPLIAGPNPSHPDPNHEGFRRHGEELVVDTEMQWMVDFEEAIRVGMGMKISLDRRTSRGLDRLIVLGLRLSADAQEGQELLERLIESHHYSEEGFSLIPQGTATNNTGSGGSGFSSFDLGGNDSFCVELGEPLFKQESDWKRKQDGQYLAEALGINPSTIDHIQFSDGFDQRDARAMNTALWPATLGYFLEEMMEPLFSPETLQQARQFFRQHVSGRGPVPAIRVGRQPYGILATSAFSRWGYPVVEAAEAKGMNPIHSRSFEQQLYKLLMRLDQEWDVMLQTMDISHIGSVFKGDPQQNLLDILGLHASSAEFYHRFAVSLEQLHNMLKLKQIDPMALNEFWRSNALQIIPELSQNADELPDIFKKVFFKSQTQLRQPVDDAPLSDTERLENITQDNKNYIHWLAKNPLDTIRRQDFGRKGGKPIEPPQSLLYLMLRHAVMNAYWDTAWNFYHTAELLQFIPPRKEPAFLYIKDEMPGESKFSILYRPAGELSQKHPTVFSDPNLTVAEQISQPDIIQLRPESRSLREVRQALECLKDRPTNALARAFGEHIDLCSYRLDAWKLGLVNQRLSELRGAGDVVNQGIYLGAFGWLEQVRPQDNLQTFNGSAPDEFLKSSAPPLQIAKDNAGYIHGPSLNHALTAAILRNAYITHANRDNQSVTAVNLTSERVRTALSIIEGVQNGQELGALLGYQFERGLHERYNDAEKREVDKFIFPLRKKFPLVSERLNKTNPNDPIEAIEARNVIDGLALLQYIQKNGKRGYPFGFKPSELPKATKREAQAINAEVNRLEDMMDAVNDLLTAESVYQVVKGNYERSGAVMDALSKAEHLPELEILKTPRSGLGMTHRLSMQFETEIPVTQQNPYDSDIPLTPRAQAEPGLNKWLARLLGNPNNVVCRVVSVDGKTKSDSENAEDSNNNAVSLKDLKLQPIDLLYILDQDLQQNQSELDSRIAFAFRTKKNLKQDAKIGIEYTEPVSGKITFFELMPLLKCLKLLIIESRALNAEDMVLPSDEAQDLNPNAKPDKNPQGWNLSDIQMRVKNAHKSLAQLKQDLEKDRTALSPIKLSSGAFSSTRSHLMLAALFGLQQSIPESAIEVTAEVAEELKSQAGAVVELIEERLKAYKALFPLAKDTSIAQQVEIWIEAGKKIFGPSFAWIPTFNLKLPDEISHAHKDSEHILRHIKTHSVFPVDEWLHGLARVRTKAQCLEQSILMADNFSRPTPELTPMQLPYRKDDYWLAMEYPTDYEFDSDRLLLTTVFTAPLKTEKPQAGLLLDEWVEVVPTRNETTGIAFHFDAPNSEPPQTLLLAVPPTLTGSWSWDDLVAILNETLDMAKKRAVEPRHIDTLGLSQLLPAVMIPVTPYPITIATNLLANVGMASAIAAIENIELNQDSG